ncbi:MAG: NUDIX domain-containing protein, partial [Candidatus Dadabacteria bacterium]|nr:NUDIX domain-containing protein [Candidatus Dadabacteria bacterium]
MCSEKVYSISRILQDGTKEEISGDGTNVFAAVMMILKQSDEILSTLLIKRSTSDSDVFSGHMAFPGGKIKNEDKNRLDTAVRETNEEVGIDLRGNSIILGKLDDCRPSTPAARKYIVTPFVCYLKEDRPLSINQEVSEAVWMPVSELKNIYLSNFNKYK